MQFQLLNLLLIFKFCISNIRGLKSYSEDQVNAFIDSARTLNLSPICRSSLRNVHSFLYAYDTVRQQRDFFYASYASSTSAKMLLSRDRSRWHYNMLECLLAAGETAASVSEHPLMYCNGYKDLISNSSAIGLCLPSTCFPEKQQLTRFWATYADSVNASTIETVECTKSRHQKQWYQRPWTVFELIINKSLMGLVALSTVYHAMRGTKTKSLALQLLLAFSAIRNLKAITQQTKNPHLITCIFGVRVIATLWVTFSHSAIFIQDFMENIEDYRNALKDSFFGQLLTNVYLSVDTFFLISGTLTSYCWFRSRQRTDEPMNLSYWLQFYWHRIVRLWPAYAYTLYVFYMRYTVLHFHGAWKLDDQRDKCGADWWKNLLFINSLTDNECLPWTWYIGTDFIFYLLSPIYLLSFKRSEKLGVLVSLSTIVASSILTAIKMHQYNFPPTQMLWVMPSIFNPDFMQHHRTMYIRPQYRIGTYLVGVMLGYYLVANDKKLSRTSLRCGWSLSVVLGLVSLFGLYPALQEWNWWIYYLIYAALHRVMWATAIAWLILVCHYGHAYYLNCFLSLRIFALYSAVCYSLYLIHMFPVIALFMSGQFPIVYHGMQTLFAYAVPQILLSSGLGFVTVLIIEFPFMNIDRIIRTRRKSCEVQVKGPAKQREILNLIDADDDHLPLQK